jgi:hypothetical protein
LFAEQQTFLYFHSLSVSIFCPTSHSNEHQVLVGLASCTKDVDRHRIKKGLTSRRPEFEVLAESDPAHFPNG